MKADNSICSDGEIRARNKISFLKKPASNLLALAIQFQNRTNGINQRECLTAARVM